MPCRYAFDNRRSGREFGGREEGLRRWNTWRRHTGSHPHNVPWIPPLPSRPLVSDAVQGSYLPAACRATPVPMPTAASTLSLDGSSGTTVTARYGSVILLGRDCDADIRRGGVTAMTTLTGWWPGWSRCCETDRRQRPTAYCDNVAEAGKAAKPAKRIRRAPTCRKRMTTDERSGSGCKRTGGRVAALMAQDRFRFRCRSSWRYDLRIAQPSRPALVSPSAHLGWRAPSLFPQTPDQPSPWSRNC